MPITYSLIFIDWSSFHAGWSHRAFLTGWWPHDTRTKSPLSGPGHLQMFSKPRTWLPRVPLPPRVILRNFTRSSQLQTGSSHLVINIMSAHKLTLKLSVQNRATGFLFWQKTMARWIIASSSCVMCGSRIDWWCL